MKKLDHKTVLITGALSGIGKACAIAAAKEGANLALIDLSPDANTLAEIRTHNQAAIYIPCNVTDFEGMRRAVAETIKMFGGLDVALNNAGIAGIASRIGDMEESAWLEVTGVNLNGVFNGMRHQLAAMVLQKSGNIVNMSSILGQVGFSNSAHYVAAKHAVIGLTRATALEYADSGIRINAICPGFTDTPMLSNSGINNNQAIHDMLVNMHPMKRFATSEEIARGFIFLACPDSSFITGSTLAIDGGYLAQ